MQWLTAFNPFVFLFDMLLEGRMQLPIGFVGFASGHLAATVLLLFLSVTGNAPVLFAVGEQGGKERRRMPARSGAVSTADVIELAESDIIARTRSRRRLPESVAPASPCGVGCTCSTRTRCFGKNW